MYLPTLQMINCVFVCFCTELLSTIGWVGSNWPKQLVRICSFKNQWGKYEIVANNNPMLMYLGNMLWHWPRVISLSKYYNYDALFPFPLYNINVVKVNEPSKQAFLKCMLVNSKFSSTLRPNIYRLNKRFYRNIVWNKVMSVCWFRLALTNRTW